PIHRPSSVVLALCIPVDFGTIDWRSCCRSQCAARVAIVFCFRSGAPAAETDVKVSDLLIDDDYGLDEGHSDIEGQHIRRVEK
ncbi:unnamed protein product, partial [Callosobruchus maculatus]